ncbi:hypothetical protein SGRA_3088 [Saprospira grandis str. Lewin]|uniref:Uncharacterized protein n=1 Tax=Saprospira grandis (strain Lewin) TaxID=984262 RepID=H6KZP0_SAPGL|nr:hypothetical protein SGRA_3088 [Saprospira grandis str. Lewin]
MFFDVFFGGCPALRAGRAVSQLAVLLGPAPKSVKRFLARSGPSGHCFPSLSRGRFAPFWTLALCFGLDSLYI